MLGDPGESGQPGFVLSLQQLPNLCAEAVVLVGPDQQVAGRVEHELIDLCGAASHRHAHVVLAEEQAVTLPVEVAFAGKYKAVFIEM